MHEHTCTCIKVTENEFVTCLELELAGLSLTPGNKYCTRVSACNFAGICSSVTSDGFIMDTSPPAIGQVLDGISGYDTQFQSDRFVFLIRLVMSFLFKLNFVEIY